MSAHSPTREQLAAIDALATGGGVVIHAGAGTGKTSTLRLLAAGRPGAPGLHVAYNKAIKLEATRSFPDNVQPRGAHSLAHRTFGAQMSRRLNGRRVTSREAAAILHAPSVQLAQCWGTPTTVDDSTLVSAVRHGGVEHPLLGLPSVDTLVRVSAHRGVWKVKGIGKDGSVTVFGGTRGQWHSVGAERARPIAARRAPRRWSSSSGSMDPRNEDPL